SHELVRNGARSIAAQLPAQIGTDRVVAPRIMLGLLRSWLAVAALALSAILGLISVWLHPGPAGWIYLLAIAATCWLVRRGVAREARRSPIAVVAISLEI